MKSIDFSKALPQDADRATLVGRIWRPDADGPSVVTIRGVVDVTSSFATVRDLCERDDPAVALAKAKGDAVISHPLVQKSRQVNARRIYDHQQTGSTDSTKDSNGR
jgi:fumarylacetoacetate (FAA) hydrolase family protein